MVVGLEKPAAEPKARSGAVDKLCSVSACTGNQRMSRGFKSCPVCQQGQPAFFLEAPFGKRDRLFRRYHRCPTCRAILLDPEFYLSRKEEQDFYAGHENHAQDPGYRYFHQPAVDLITDYIGDATDGLDYGCGPDSAFAAMLEERGFNITRYDPEFYPDLDALNHRYAFIGCIETAEHFHHPAQEFATLASLLRPGGILLIQTATPPADNAFARWYYRRDPSHVVFYPHDCLAVIAAHTQLALIHQEPDRVVMQRQISIQG